MSAPGKYETQNYQKKKTAFIVHFSGVFPVNILFMSENCDILVAGYLDDEIIFEINSKIKLIMYEDN
jgi:hypothetical protein